jgi:hypothetical protein
MLVSVHKILLYIAVNTQVIYMLVPVHNILHTVMNTQKIYMLVAVHNILLYIAMIVEVRYIC